MGGSERKSKKRRSPSNSISEDEGRSKRHKSREEKENKKISRSRKHSDKGEKHDRKHKKRDQHPDFQELSTDDYFSKNNEFATWLKEKKGLFFSDLSSDVAREKFLGFIKDWNNHKLESRYYVGITSGPRTAHNWKVT